MLSRILFILVPVILMGIIMAVLLHLRWKEIYYDYYDLSDVETNEWAILALIIPLLIFSGVFFNLIYTVIWGG
jgi:hypothetical protein